MLPDVKAYCIAVVVIRQYGVHEGMDSLINGTEQREPSYTATHICLTDF